MAQQFTLLTEFEQIRYGPNEVGCIRGDRLTNTVYAMSRGIDEADLMA
jgi:hypothetical protein